MNLYVKFDFKVAKLVTRQETAFVSTTDIMLPTSDKKDTNDMG